MTWTVEFRPGNKIIYVVFDEESEFSGPRTPNLRPDKVFEENVPYGNLKKKCFDLIVILISICFICSLGYLPPTVSQIWNL